MDEVGEYQSAGEMDGMTRVVLIEQRHADWGAVRDLLAGAGFQVRSATTDIWTLPRQDELLLMLVAPVASSAPLSPSTDHGTPSASTNPVGSFAVLPSTVPGAPEPSIGLYAGAAGWLLVDTEAIIGSPLERLQSGMRLTETIENVLPTPWHTLSSSYQVWEVQFLLDNDPELVPYLVSVIDRVLRVRTVTSDDDIFRVSLAVREALLNAIYHGNLEVSSELRQADESPFHQLANERRGSEPYCNRKVRFRIRVTPHAFHCAILDEGPGFDPDAIPDPTDTANLARPSGRGLFLIRTLMDAVLYSPRGNEVILVKRFTPPPSANPSPKQG